MECETVVTLKTQIAALQDQVRAMKAKFNVWALAVDKIARIGARITVVRRESSASLGFSEDGDSKGHLEVCGRLKEAVGQLWRRIASVF